MSLRLLFCKNGADGRTSERGAESLGAVREAFSAVPGIHLTLGKRELPVFSVAGVVATPQIRALPDRSPA